MIESEGQLDGIFFPNRSRRSVRLDKAKIIIWIVSVICFSFLIIIMIWIKPDPFRLILELKPLIKPGKYLVLFQNDAELRPTGGFIGSFAIVSISENYRIKYDIETNIYKLDNVYTEIHKIVPPKPLQGISKEWALRDSNWAIDFKDASQTVQQFLLDESGQKVDGVIGITAHSARDLLKTVGSLKLSDGTALDENNFYDVLHYKIEKEYFIDPSNRQENEPKRILADLVPELIRRIENPVKWYGVSRWIREQLDTKQIIVALNDDRQKIVESKNWGDRINSESRYYLSLNNANLGGMKSSRSMSQAVWVNIVDRGETANYLIKITRTHHGTNVWPDHKNDNLIRLLLPLGAEPVSIELDGRLAPIVDRETTNNREVFGLRIDTDPGLSRVLTAEFKVPIDQNLSNQFVWQKQPGVDSDELKIFVNGKVILDKKVDRDMEVNINN